MADHETAGQSNQGPPWWEANQQVIDREPDPDVPGGVMLTISGDTLTVPSGSEAFTVLAPSPGHLRLTIDHVNGPIGVVATGDCILTLARARAELTPWLFLELIGRCPTDTPPTLRVIPGGIYVVGLMVESAVAVTETPMVQVSLRDAGYISRSDPTPSSPQTRVDAAGECTIDIDVPFELVAESGARVTARGRSDVERFQAGGDVTVTLAHSPSGDQGPRPTFRLVRNEGRARIEASAGTFTIADRCTGLEIAGGGVVRVEEDARATALKLSPVGPTMTLSLGPRATAEQITGVVRLAECRHARLTGAPDEPLIVESVWDTHGVGENPWSEAIISGIRVPAGIRGVPVLLGAREASIFDPDLGELPAHRDPYKRWLRRRVLQGMKEDHDLLSDSGHADLLADVTAERSTQGSIRTKAAHASYRMRQLAASSRWERSLLAAYRPFGYAQRPGPPLILWLLATAVAVPLVTISGSINPSGWTEWAELLLEVLFLPFQFLRLNEVLGAELAKLPPVLVVPLRVGLTLPFVFVVLAMRQFVRLSRH